MGDDPSKGKASGPRLVGFGEETTPKRTALQASDLAKFALDVIALNRRSGQSQSQEARQDCVAPLASLKTDPILSVKSKESAVRTGEVVVLRRVVKE